MGNHFDPLTQYVWLQMKDRPSLGLRGHSFFFVVNRRYPSYRPDQYWPVAPSEVYARTLAAWLDDRLDGPGADEFLSVAGAAQQDAAARQGLGPSEASILARILALAYIVAGEQGWAGTDMSVERALDDLYDEWAGTAGSYIRIRRDPAADVPGIVEALGQHAAIQAGG